MNSKIEIVGFRHDTRLKPVAGNDKAAGKDKAASKDKAPAVEHNGNPWQYYLLFRLRPQPGEPRSLKHL